ATFEPAEHFGVLVEAEARRRGADHAGCVVVLGDGSPWIWNLAESHFPTATHIVDLYHAREHIHDMAKLIAPILGKRYHRWVADRIAQLDAGDIEGLCDSARGLKLPVPADAVVEAALAYFETNAERMRYATFRAAGHFVGSGTVESGCKAVIGQRLKLSGMRWAEHGAAGIAALRCQQASGRWDQIWLRLHNQTSVA
ncbi:MAG: ISKra4-like element ISDesp4 family transposase, partial [Acidimicrobiales bacterium]